MEQAENGIQQHLIPRVELFTVDENGRHHDRLGRFVSKLALEQLITHQDQIVAALAERPTQPNDEPDGFIASVLQDQNELRSDISSARGALKTAAARGPRRRTLTGNLPEIKPAPPRRRQAPETVDSVGNTGKPKLSTTSDRPVEVARIDHEVKGTRYARPRPLTFKEKIANRIPFRQEKIEPTKPPTPIDPKYMHLEPALRTAAMEFDRQAELKEEEKHTLRGRIGALLTKLSITKGSSTATNAETEQEEAVDKNSQKTVDYRELGSAIVLTASVARTAGLRKVKSRLPKPTIKEQPLSADLESDDHQGRSSEQLPPATIEPPIAPPKPEPIVRASKTPEGQDPSPENNRSRRKAALIGGALAAAAFITVVASDTAERDNNSDAPTAIASPSTDQSSTHQDIVRRPKPIQTIREANLAGISSDTQVGVIGSGESIWSISANYVDYYGLDTNVYIVDAIKDATIKLNDFSDPNVIMPGAPIELPSERTVRTIVQKYS